MKRNIISSKVEPQNTEDLWLNLVDGNIYSYEYGTWTNVNNVPNRVFNLDIDYTEENLTKFLSPLYEEGFSDDDFPKKVWDKYCETNPEFKLQGERENIRINVSIKGQEDASLTPLTFRVDTYNEQKYKGNILTNIASADIKLKQLHDDSSFSITQEMSIHNSGYGTEYISGIVSNKLDIKKMWEYLGEDVKYLVPARIDTVLPYTERLTDYYPDFGYFSVWDVYGVADVHLYLGKIKNDPYNTLDEYELYSNLCSPIHFGIYKDMEMKNVPIDTLQITYPTELKDVYIDMNVKYSNYPEYWNDPSSASKAYNDPMYFIDSYLSFNNNCSLHAYPGSINNSYTAIIDDLKIGIRLSMSEEIYIFKYTTDIGRDSDPLEENIFWKMNTSIENWKKAIEYLKREYNVNEETKYKKIIINTAGMTVGDGPIIPIPELKPLEYIQFVGSEDAYATNEVTFNDVGIAIIYQNSRIGIKKCHILDKKTGIEYSLTDLGYNENFIWLPKDEISDSSNQHLTSAYMLASDFKNILDRFNILNRKHSSVEVKLEDGNTMEQYLGTNYIFTVSSSKKQKLVKLYSAEVTFFQDVYNTDNDLIAFFPDLYPTKPVEITSEFKNQLKLEGVAE